MVETVDILPDSSKGNTSSPSLRSLCYTRLGNRSLLYVASAVSPTVFIQPFHYSFRCSLSFFPVAIIGIHLLWNLSFRVTYINLLVS